MALEERPRGGAKPTAPLGHSLSCRPLADWLRLIKPHPGQQRAAPDNGEPRASMIRGPLGGAPANTSGRFKVVRSGPAALIVRNSPAGSCSRDSAPANGPAGRGLIGGAELAQALGLRLFCCRPASEHYRASDFSADGHFRASDLDANESLVVGRPAGRPTDRSGPAQVGVKLVMSPAESQFQLLHRRPGRLGTKGP